MCECTLVVGLPVRDDEARVVVSHLAETSGEDGGDVVEGLEGGQELVATLSMIDHDHDSDYHFDYDHDSDHDHAL